MHDPETDSIKAVLQRKREEAPLRPKGMLSSGSTLLNLACTGNPWRAFMRGAYYLIPGDSSAGKTVLAGTCLAEAAMNPLFDGYSLIFDNAENGALFFEKFFGPRINARIKPPKYDAEKRPMCSRTVQDFYYNAHDRLTHKPSVYVLDSEPALTSEAEQKKFKKKKAAAEEGEESAGIMSDGKAVVHSQNMRNLAALARDTDSIVIVLTQSRENMGFGAMYDPKTRPGGKALKFYAQLEAWFSIKKTIKRTVNGQPRKIGIIASVHVKKNRFTGKDRTVEIPIYTSFGIDDLGSCIDYLIKEKHWTGTEGTVTAPEFKFQGTKEKLVRLIESTNRERDLQALTGEVWNGIEAQLEVHRKRRYE